MNELPLMLSTKDMRILAEYLLVAQQAMLQAADDTADSPSVRAVALDTYLRDHASAAADLRARVLRASKHA